jgi:hypothetical protein
LRWLDGPHQTSTRPPQEVPPMQIHGAAGDSGGAGPLRGEAPRRPFVHVYREAPALAKTAWTRDGTARLRSMKRSIANTKRTNVAVIRTKAVG